MQGAPSLVRTLGRTAVSLGRTFDKFGISLSGGTQAADKRALLFFRSAPVTSAPPNPPPPPSLPPPPRLPASPVVASTRIVALKGKGVTYGLQAFIASTASIIGDVNIGESGSVWYGAVVRGAFINYAGRKRGEGRKEGRNSPIWKRSTRQSRGFAA